MYSERDGDPVLLAEVVAETLEGLGQTQVLQNGGMELARDVAGFFRDVQSTLPRRLKTFFGRTGAGGPERCPQFQPPGRLKCWQRES